MTPDPDTLRAALEAALPPALRTRLAEVRAYLHKRATGLRVYLAGGPVRDLLLGRHVTDIDLVVVPGRADEPAPAPSLARALARAQGGTVTVHGAFGTATWHDPTGAAHDFATARTETYAFPGALPTVTPAADIETDLRRRDFTINAMALRLDGDEYGLLVDPHGGQADLMAGRVRVLHAASLLDDPTRIFRALRYEQRLNFHLAAETEALIPTALPVLAGLSGERVRHELELVFREAEPAGALARLEACGALRTAHAALRWGEAEVAASGIIPTLPLPEWQWAGPLDVDSLYLALLLRGAAAAEAGAALARLAVTRAVETAVTGALALRLTGERPSEVVAQLDRLSLEGVAAAYVLWPAYRERIDAYLARWRHIRAALTGDDLLGLGLAPGPDFKQILGRLRAARLDGEVADDEAERALARALAGLE